MQGRAPDELLSRPCGTMSPTTTASWWPGCAGQVSSSSGEPPHPSSGTTRPPSPSCSASAATRGTWSGPRVDQAAAPQQPSQRAWYRVRAPAMELARFESHRPAAACSGSSRRAAATPWPRTQEKRYRGSPSSMPSHGRCATAPRCSTPPRARSQGTRTGQPHLLSPFCITRASTPDQCVSPGAARLRWAFRLTPNAGERLGRRQNGLKTSDIT